MDYQDLKRVVREQYPFPIAYAHKKTLGVLDDNVEKLKCLVETAEATIQFLALLALAQVRQDLLNVPQNRLEREEHPPTSPSLRWNSGQARGDYPSPTPSKREEHPPTPPSRGDYPATAPAERGIDLSRLREEITLTNPTFGKWNRLAREVMKAYCNAKDQLIVPELFDLFWRWDPSGQKLRSQRLDNTVVGPLITLRNDFHHGRVPDSKVQEKVTEGLNWLHQLLEAIQFLAQYQLSFTQQIVVDDAQQRTYYVHDLTLLDGCVSVFDRSRWRSEMCLKSGSVILLHSREGQHLILTPFLIFTDQIKGVSDLCVLNTVVHKKAVYVSCQFGEELSTKDDKWVDGPLHHEALSEFFDLLQSVPQTSSFAPGSAGIIPPLRGARGVSFPVRPLSTWEGPGVGKAPLEGGRGVSSPLSTAEVFQQKYREPEPIVQHTSPYKFLDYYNPEDHDIFFGRDREIRFLLQKFYNSRLLVLHGESGTGKTSLIRAGLIPRLDPESYIPVYVRILKDPLHEIKQELMHQLGLDDVHPGCPQVAGCDSPLEGPVLSEVEGGQGSVNKHPVTRFARQPGFALDEFLSHVTERISKTVVIVLDQFEEFFLRFPEDVRQQFAAELAACIDTPRLDVKFLIALRSDYFASLAAFESSIPQIFTHQLQLERLTEAQALEAVIKPPEQLGIQVDEAMVQIKLLPELVSEEGIEPPLLQIVCDALYQNAQSEGRQEIGMTDYEAIGDVKGCLGRYLDSKLRQFGKKQVIARAVLKALVTAEGTKRASFVEELFSRMQSVFPPFGKGGPGGILEKQTDAKGEKIPPNPPLEKGGVEITEDTLTHDYLDKFVHDRLVRVEEVEGRARYELSHDYLVKHIEAWIEESEREVTKVLEVIDRAYEAYQATDLLLESSALQMIKPYEDQLVLPAEKQAFVDRSKTQVRKKRRGLLLKVGVALLSVALVLGGIFGYQKYQDYQALKYQKEQAENARKDAEQQAQNAQEARIKAESQARIAQARRLAVEAQAVLEEFPQRSLLLAVEALNVTLHEGEPRIPAAEQVLRDALAKTGGIGLSGGVIAISPDGHWLATGNEDGTVRLWNLNAPDPAAAPLVLHGHEDTIRTVAFSPDTHWLITGSDDATARLWDLTAENPTVTSLVFRGHKRSIETVAFSPNMHWLATGSWDMTARLWDLTAEDPTAAPLVFHGHERGIMTAVAFSSDAHWLATGSWDGTTRLWDLTAENPTVTSLVFRGHKRSIETVAFSPDRHWLATGSDDATARLWDLTAENPTVTSLVFRGHKRSIETVAFSPNMHWLATGSWDDTARLWDLTAEDPTAAPLVLRGHEDDINAVAFSTDTHWLVTGSDDDTARLWNLTAPDPAAAPLVLRGHWQDIKTVAFSPDTHWLVTGSGDNTVRLWDLTAPDPAASPLVLRGHEKEITTAIFSPDMHWLATGSFGYGGDGTARLWTLRLDELIERACLTAGRNLSYTEWEQYFREEDYRRTCPDLPIHPDMIITARNSAKAHDIDGALVIFQQILELDSSLDFDPKTESHKWAAKGLLEKGRQLAYEGKVQEATAAYEKAKTLDPRLDLDPTAEAQKWATKELIEKGKQLAEEGKVQEAIAAYEEAKKIDPSLELEANKLMAQSLVEKGKQLAEVGKVKEAIAAYEEAQTLDPTLEISAGSWNHLCWDGSLWGYAAEVMDACEKAVALAPKNGGIRDSRGLARALTGNIEGAIEDFQAFVGWTEDAKWYEKPRAQRQGWIEAILAGENPFTPEVLVEMLYEAKLFGPGWITNVSQWNWNTLGVNLWKQGNIDKAAHAFAKALRLQPNNVLFLHNDAKLALVQGDISRCQKRIATAMPLVKPDSDSYPLFPFYAWVADPEQGWEPIMRAIEELDSDVELFFISSTFEPVLKRLDKETREIAQQFIEFFQGKIDLKTLKARLAEHEPIPSVPDTGE